MATVGLHELHQALTHAVAEGLGPDLAVLDSVAALHHRASQWYERNGEPSKAIRHALAGGDVERAAGLVELAIPALRRSRQEATVRGWLEALPGDVVRVRPVLAVSLNTLRTHTRNIYAKLGVNSRRAAVRQAAERNLLSRARDR